MQREDKHDSASSKGHARRQVTVIWGRAIGESVSFVVRFIASVAISTWGLAMVLLGILNGFFLWIAIGLAVTVVGVPLLGSHPWVARRLYPTSGNLERAAPPEPALPQDV